MEAPELLKTVHEVLANDKDTAEERCMLARRLIELLGPVAGVPGSAPADAKQKRSAGTDAPRRRQKRKKSKSKGHGSRYEGSKSQRIVEAVRKLGGEASLEEVGTSLAITSGAERKRLGTMMANQVVAGRLKRVGEGRYAIA